MKRNALLIVCLFASLPVGCELATPPSNSQMLRDALPPTATIPPNWVSPADPDAVTNDWLKRFNDPQLEALVAEAIANNTDLRAAAARVEAARQLVTVVGSQMLPQVGANFGFGATRDDDNRSWGTGSTVYLGVGWEPDIWGKLRAQTESTKARFEATALEYAWARQSLAATTAKAWFLATETHKLLQLMEQAVDVYSELLELAKVRLAAGKVSDLDVAEAGASANAAKAQLSMAQAADFEARRALELVLGRYPSAEIASSDDYPAVPQLVKSGLPSSLLENRPDLLAARRKIVQAFRSEEAAKLAFLPSFTLGIEGGRLENNLLTLLRLNPWLLRSAVGMTIPIYTGGRLEGRVQIATAEQQVAVAGYGSAVLAAFSEVENALTQQRLLTRTLAYSENAERDRAEAVRIARLKYAAGATDMLTVLQLQGDRIAAQTLVIKYRNAQLANCVQLFLALGAGFDSAPASSLVGSAERTEDASDRAARDLKTGT